MGKEYKYKSPITVYDQLENMTTLDDIAELARKAANAVDDAIVCSVQHEVGIKVDRNELLRALMYDRKQYEKGYDDGYRDGTADVEPVVHCKDCKHRDPEDKKCDGAFAGKQGLFPMADNDFCSYGAKMDGKENEE